jgi:DNA repair protein RadC
VRLPVYKLKLIRSGWMAYPPIDLEHPQLAAYFFHRLIGQGAVEHSAAIFVDPVGQVTGSCIISVGDLARVQMLAREAFKAAILANASGLILAHNHPAPSSSKPSPQDVCVTQRLIRAGRILGIDVLDHIIVTPSDKDFTSMREAGFLSLSRPEISELRPPSAPAVPQSIAANS